MNNNDDAREIPSPPSVESADLKYLTFTIELQLCFSKTSRMTSMVFQLRVVAGMPRCFSTTALEYV